MSCSTKQFTLIEPSPDEIKLSNEVYEFLVAEFLVHQEDLDSALGHYENLAYLTQDENIYATALSLAMQLQNYPRALAITEKWLTFDETNPNLHQLVAGIYLELGQYESSLPHIEFLVENNDDIYTQQYSRLSIFDTGQKEGEQIKELVGLYPDNSYVLLLYALFQLNVTDYSSALRTVEDVLLYRPKWLKAQAVKADVLFALGRVEEGLELLEHQADLHPMNQPLLLKVAKQYFLYDRDIKSYILYKRIYKIETDIPEVIYALGVLHLRMLDFEKARRFFSRLATYANQHNNQSMYQRASYYLGRVDEDEGKFNDAVLRYSMIDDQSLFNEAVISIARVFRKTGRFDLVNAEFKKARIRSSDDRTKIALFIAQAEMLHKFAPKKEVLSIYRDALDEYRNELNILYSRAMFASNIKDFRLAEADLRKIIKSDSENWQAMNALGYLWADNNIKLQEAKAFIQKAYQLQPHSAAVVDSVGWIEYRLNNIEEAENYVTKAAKMHKHPEILGHLAEIFLTQSKKDKAFEVLNEALREFPDDEYLKEIYNFNFKK